MDIQKGKLYNYSKKNLKNKTMQLQTYKNYTVDYRLQQFRSCEGGWDSFGEITFIDFKSPQGDAIICEMIKAGVFDLSKYNL